MRHNLAIAIAAVILALSGGGDARAFDFFWDAASGSWNVGSNWTSSIGGFVPDGGFGDDAFIENGGTAQLIGAAAINPVRNLRITDGVLDIQSGGSLEVLQFLTASGDGQIQLSGDAMLDVAVNASNSVKITGPSVTYTVGGDYETSNLLIADITGPSHSEIQVTGAATLGGALQVNISGVVPVAGQSWPLINAASVSGTFSSVDTSGAPALPRGQQYLVTQDLANGDVGLTVGNALILSVNRVTGAATMENAVGDPINFHGYTIRSPGGSLSPAGWSRFAASGVAGPGWAVAPDPPISQALGELNLTADASLTVGNSFQLGNALAVGVRPEGEDLLFEYTTVDDQLVSGFVEYTGRPNSLELAVDPASGEGVLRNGSVHIAPPDITGYAITSVSGSLTPGTWTSFEDNPGEAGLGWAESNPTSGHLAERNPDSSTMFSNGSAISLGQMFSLTGSTDLVLQYSTIAGELRMGVVTYDGYFLEADFNEDTNVDDTDLSLWEGGFGTLTGALKIDGDSDGDGDVDGGDFLKWQAQVGLSTGGGSQAIAAVPEPASMMLLASSLAVLFGLGRSASGVGSPVELDPRREL